MKSILLIGLGRFGKHIAIKLNELDQQVMAVDKSEEKVNALLPFVTNAQIGDSTDEEFLASLGVRNYDVCIVAIGSDFQSSLETTSLLKELGAQKVVSRAARDVQAKFLLRNGADEVVYPEKDIATWTAVKCSGSNVLDYVELEEGCAVIETKVPNGWDGKTVGEINIRQKHNVTIMALRKDGKIFFEISSGTRLEKGQAMIILGEHKELQKVLRLWEV